MTCIVRVTDAWFVKVIATTHALEGPVMLPCREQVANVSGWAVPPGNA
jgi:hypothetical protein